MHTRTCEHCDKLALYNPLKRGKKVTAIWSTSGKGRYCLKHAEQAG